MRNLINAFLDSSKDRLKNPFIGAFVFAWIGINWRPIITLLFSEKSIAERIQKIETDYSSLWLTLFLPLIIAVFYIVVIPYIMWLFDTFSNLALKNRKENLFKHRMHDIEGRKKMAIGESEIEEIKSNYREKADLNKKMEQMALTLEKKNEIIENLQVKVETLTTDYDNLKKLSTDATNLSFTLEEEQKLNKEYSEFRNEDYSEYFEEVGAEVSQNNSVPDKINKIIIEKYIYAGIIKKIEDRQEQTLDYVFTRKGRYFWKEYVSGIRVSKPTTISSADDLPF
ncbi:hypothetical protein Celly_2239 [Cellulophaga lytica DSM 7489]|uniref:Uncharacterized protein n=1 Tax=Cellulophaga lytica (strain ATCC 23178 / DSM 7489 / JCM 8516 / NBRC 14961 / NCIMB 1423 / VKM B-1433 / Cy l20) TaxID=867900 RepID=F0RFT4_CELLC|nr:hypothetical protein [Cellulophaga lytica]ADY30059.1 hypothetical protein Celly_2239 [Cellulophaga lytica DSM 7489]WQG75778.1 hypothetical protein SR888_08760 [Cellulophaga lytica]